jgi:hypothetical protein
MKSSTYHSFFVVHAHIISVAISRGVWSFKDAYRLKKKMRWCIRYYSWRERWLCMWNVWFDVLRLWEKTCTMETNSPYLRTILCGNTVKEKNCNIPWVAPWHRQCLWLVACVFWWLRPWSRMRPMETNRPWLHLLIVWGSAQWKWVWLILVFYVSHGGWILGPTMLFC